MSVYTPPATNAVDFAVTSFTPADLTPAVQALSAYTPPALNAVDFALTSYTQPTYPYVGWELLPGAGPVNKALVCAAGAYVYAGQAATLTVGRRLALEAGAYNYIGNSATLTVARNFALNPGAYIYTGNAASLDYVPGGTPTPDAPTTGGKGDNASRKRGAIFKPTGLTHTLTKPVKNKDVARRIAETAEIHAEVAGVEQTVAQPLPTLDAKLAEQSGAALLTYEMSQLEMIAEIKMLLEKAARSDEEEALLLIFMEAI